MDAFGGDDARDAGEVVGHGDVGPRRGVEEGAYGGEAVVAELEDEQAAGGEAGGGLPDQVRIQLVALFTAVESDLGLVFADFARQGRRFAAGDVGRVADDEIQKT